MRERIETTVEGHTAGQQWGKSGAPDYGVFDFAHLFSNALNDHSPTELTEDEEEALRARYTHRVSDHMPIWLRMPLPRRERAGFPRTLESE